MNIMEISLHRWKGSFTRLPVLLCLLLELVVAAVAGCSTHKHFSEDFGQSYHEGFSAQVANPSAPIDPQPADTLPGEIADLIYQQRYVKSMTAELEAADDEGQSQSINTLK